MTNTGTTTARTVTDPAAAEHPRTALARLRRESRTLYRDEPTEDTHMCPVCGHAWCTDYAVSAD